MNFPDEKHLQDPSTEIATTTRVCQIITFALIQGVFLYAAIVVFMKQGRLDGPAGFLSWTALGVSGLLFVLHLIIPELVSASGIRRLAETRSSGSGGESGSGGDEDASALCNIFRTQHVFRCALLEGGAILATTAYLIEGSWMAIAVCAAMAGSMVARFPTANGVRTWIMNQSHQFRMHSR